VRWLKVDNVANAQSVVKSVRLENLIFHTIIYCGSVDRFPEELVAVLSQTGNASIMAPVKDPASDKYSFQLLQRRNGTREMRTITDFGVIFEGVK